MRKLLVLITISVFLVAACAPGSEVELDTEPSPLRLTTPNPNPQLNEPDPDGRVAGLGLGLWHGIIAPVTLVGSFFNPNWQIYEVYNNGAQYNLGFLIGVALIFLILGVFGGRWR